MRRTERKKFLYTLYPVSINDPNEPGSGGGGGSAGGGVGSYGSTDRTQSISRIIIHHTGGSTLSGALTTLQQRGLSYHVIIDTNGDIIRLVDYDRVAYHAGNANGNSIGLSFVGDFTKLGYPTFQQINSCKTLIAEIYYAYDVHILIGHRDTKPTSCPAFDISALQNYLQYLIELDED